MTEPRDEARDVLADLLTNIEYLMEDHGTRVIDIEDLRAVVRDQRAADSAVLVATPEPAPDVEALREALKQVADLPSHFSNYDAKMLLLEAKSIARAALHPADPSPKP